MSELNNKQIRRISREIDRSGLTYTELQEELLDHLCCDVEAEMNEGLEFIKALEKVTQRIGESRLQEIQEETLLLINQKYRIMKKSMYVLGIIAPSLLLLGALFNWQHLPGGGLMITFSLFLLGAIFIPVFVMIKIRDTRENRKPVNRSLYLTGMITGILFAATALFKIQHIPGGRILIIISMATALVAFVPAMIMNIIRDKENQLRSFSNLVFALCFIGLMFTLISMTVSREILEAFVLAGESIEDTRSLLESKNIDQLNTVNAFKSDDKLLVSNMNELRSRTIELNDFIQSLRIEIVVQTKIKNRDAVDNNRNIDLGRIIDLEEVYVPAEIMIGRERDGAGSVLKRKIEEFREYLLSLIKDEATGVHKAILGNLNTDDPVPDDKHPGGLPLTWEDHHFAHLPLIAVLNNLSRIQTNILMAENDVMQALLLAETKSGDSAGKALNINKD